MLNGAWMHVQAEVARWRHGNVCMHSVEHGHVWVGAWVGAVAVAPRVHMPC